MAESVLKLFGIDARLNAQGRIRFPQTVWCGATAPRLAPGTLPRGGPGSLTSSYRGRRDTSKDPGPFGGGRFSRRGAGAPSRFSLKRAQPLRWSSNGAIWHQGIAKNSCISKRVCQIRSGEISVAQVRSLEVGVREVRANGIRIG